MTDVQHAREPDASVREGSADVLELSLGVMDYLDRTHAFFTGEVSAPGIALELHRYERVRDLFQRMCSDDSHDVGEMSFSTYMILRGRGDDRFVGLPVFPARAFRHRQIYVNADAGIDRPEHLRGKTVGLREYQVTAAMWVRAILQHEYGVHPGEISWVYGGVDSPAWSERLEHDFPAGVSIERIPENEALSGLLERGEIDALVATQAPAPYRDGSPDVRRLFERYRPVEEAYYTRTRLFPIMHLIVVVRELYEREPWVAAALLEAFRAAKEVGRARIRDLDVLAISDPWWEAELERIDARFGGDAFPYGLAANRATVEAMIAYSHEQGLSRRRLAVDELFAEETWSS